MTTGENQRTVLVVEDNPHTAELLDFNFNEAGFRVRVAEDGHEAVRVLRSDTVDVIVCDIMMPKLDGFELREFVMRDPVLREIAFIFLTAKTLAEDELRGLATGADEYVTKPFDPEVLIARVRAVLKRREEFDRVARLDPLTQMLNRPTLEKEIQRELERLRRYAGVGVLVFLDIDGFKQFNDKYEHAVGDRVLQHLARVIGANVRQVDLVGRYGGEEFVLFFPATTSEQAIGVVERMQRGFRSFPDENLDESLTFSAGVAEAPRDGIQFSVLSGKADKAMYQAKREGKDRIIMWDAADEAEAR
jgi:diguanylate cyclase (GGDEF)-like protein